MRFLLARYDHAAGKWSYLTGAYRYNTRLRRWWRLPSVEVPTADACLAFHDDTLYLIGGSRARYRYAHEPSRVMVLKPEFDGWNGSVVGELLAPRMWHACVVIEGTGQDGIVVAGGYYNGANTMFMPFTGSVSTHR